jgi:hypothetical protein
MIYSRTFKKIISLISITCFLAAMLINGSADYHEYFSDIEDAGTFEYSCMDAAFEKPDSSCKEIYLIITGFIFKLSCKTHSLLLNEMVSGRAPPAGTNLYS